VSEKQNAKTEPKIYYCRHISQGICGYNNETILVTDDVLKNMNPEFAGKPVYVEHKKVDLDNMQEQADGYVVESFFCKEDGKHWAKFIVVSDRGHEAIARGYKVSNAYEVEEFGVGGEWHAIKYDREVMKGKYTHLALVDNPRYEEAQIMTPQEFKEYREREREQINRLQNSKNKSVRAGFFNFLNRVINNDVKDKKGNIHGSEDGRFKGKDGASGSRTSGKQDIKTDKEKERSERRQKTFEKIKQEVSAEVRAKMESVKIDFDRDNVLPELNKREADDLRIKPKKIRLKKEIIDRQDIRHSEIPLKDTNMLIATALYAPDVFGRDRNNGYITFIKRLSKESSSPLVLLDAEESEECYDIVHYHFIKGRQLKKKEETIK
jgi:hypothetical protein